MASTKKGVCYMTFKKDKIRALQVFKQVFPNTVLQQKSDEHQQNALGIFN